MPENRAAHDGVRDGVRDAVCIDAGRVYDSCAEKDCMENLLVRFTQHDQMIIDHAVSVRGKRCEVITVFIDVEPLPFHSGFFSCDLTFFFEVECEVFVGRG
ncbi:MAG: hypothetical protein FWF49_06450, partial [Oscillospiraceae bacterium]|nr:hypothetical protein [Oscillospiraceae bacterium]